MPRIIEVKNLSKRYQLGRSLGGQMLRERLVELVRHPFSSNRKKTDSIWALQDVSFGVAEGEVVGIIGRNGAGKSTLLKILSRITYPTSGKVNVRGRVASLLEVGTGFHDELTGRENIYLNGSILGMRKREIDERFEAIVAFANVEKFLDTPIKRYSSGMRLRLGFAVAAHLEPDILIVDEVLAVGDGEFQKKCIKAMEGLRNKGRTVLFVSHNLAAVENLCSRGIWIDAGKVRMDGDAREVITNYMRSFVGDRSAGYDLTGVEGRLGTGEIRFTRLEFLYTDGTPCAMIRSGDGLIMRFHYHAEVMLRDPTFGLELFTEMGTLIMKTGPWLHGMHHPKVGPGCGYIEVEFDSLNLVPGNYALSLWITAWGGKPIYDGDVRTMFEVEVVDVYKSGYLLDHRYGIAYFQHQWRQSQS